MIKEKFYIQRKRLRSLRTHGAASSPVTFSPCVPPSGTFQLELRFSNDYPNKPPHVRFLSKLFHPNGGPVYIRFGGKQH